MVELGLILVGLVVVVALAVVLLYNSLISSRNRVENAWSQIDVQLRRRFDLIPNLVETVKGYAKHEKSIFENVAKARSAMMSAETVGAKAKADNQLTGALKTLFAVAENYPQLRASENFQQLQEEVAGTESKIAFSRQFYNDNVMSYNTSLQTFPNSAFASMFGFTAKDYFDAGGEEARKAVKISF